ncbi:O-antigen ligase family protein, partial [Streptomyces sp. T-3]|nr:O-antigen ligase family protein [Streptomyces sp. T-3]
LGALLMWSALRGAATYGLQQSGLGARGVFQFCAVALFAASLPATRATLTVVVRLWTGYAVVLCGAVLLWWTRRGLGGAGQVVLIDGVLTESRPLSAMEALVIGQAAVLLLYRYGSAVWARLLAGSMVVVVVLMQSRSGWVACAAMLAGLLLLRRPGVSRRATLAKVVGACSLVLLAGLVARSSSLTRQLLASGQDSGTFAWRVEGWSSAFPLLNGPLDWLFGVPFGADTRRLVEGGLTDVSTHNHFLDVLLHQGLLGVCALTALLVCVWRRAPFVPDGLLLRVLILGLVGFSFTYPLRPEQAVLTGLLALLAGRRTTAPPTAPTAAPQIPAPHTLETPCPAVPR